MIRFCKFLFFVIFVFKLGCNLLNIVTLHKQTNIVL